MTRRDAALALLVVALIGAGIASAPRLATFFDIGDRDRTQPIIPLSDLASGTFVEVELKTSRAFVLRDFDAQVYVFSVPYSDTAYWLPEFDWSHPAIPCARFEPDNKDGVLIPNGKFRCLLPDHGEFFRYEHSWSYSGKNQGYRTADMKVAEHEIINDAVRLTRWE